MRVWINIRDNTTGEVRRIPDVQDWDVSDPDWAEDYLWTDGNYGCDCNRGLFFARAHGDPTESRTWDCGTDRFSIRVISAEAHINRKAAIVYDEFDK
jgi:hypothetical protein